MISLLSFGFIQKVYLPLWLVFAATIKTLVMVLEILGLSVMMALVLVLIVVVPLGLFIFLILGHLHQLLPVLDLYPNL
jgi:hypothetical protein